MRNYPQNCTVCPYERCCGSAMYMVGCEFYPPVVHRSFMDSLKNFLGKLFK